MGLIDRFKGKPAPAVPEQAPVRAPTGLKFGAAKPSHKCDLPSINVYPRDVQAELKAARTTLHYDCPVCGLRTKGAVETYGSGYRLNWETNYRTVYSNGLHLRWQQEEVARLQNLIVENELVDE